MLFDHRQTYHNTFFRDDLIDQCLRFNISSADNPDSYFLDRAEDFARYPVNKVVSIPANPNFFLIAKIVLI